MERQKLFGLPDLKMDVIQAEKVALSHTWRASDINSPFTRVYMVTDGIGYLKYGENTITMTKGNIYIIPAGFTLSYYCEDGFNKIYFHISLRQASGYDALEGLDKCLEIYDPEGISLIDESFDCDTAIKITQIKAYLYNIMCESLKQKEDVKIVRYSDYIKETMTYIGKNLSASLTVEKIADALYTSAGKLRKTFQAETGISIGRYIDDKIMFTAELEVRCGNLSIKEISDTLGFCDQFYFSRCFSKKYGISPLKYRKEQLYR